LSEQSREPHPNLIQKNEELGDSLDQYKASLARLSQMVEDLA
jgi:hypothetical protein